MYPAKDRAMPQNNRKNTNPYTNPPVVGMPEPPSRESFYTNQKGENWSDYSYNNRGESVGAMARNDGVGV
jgi:hypothetical protein